MIYSDEEKKLGQFFTSNRITEYIVSRTNFDEKKTIIDISCGDGAFLISCCNHLQQKNNKKTQNISNIYGIDIDKKQLTIAKKNIRKICPNFVLKKNLIVDDVIQSISQNILKKFPRVQIQKGFDIIVGNPPYVTIKSTKLIKSDPDFSPLVYGQINIATLFIGRAYSLLKDGGKLGLLLPKSILRVDSYKKLRDFLISKFLIEEIIDVGIEFDDVRGEQFILIATKKQKNSKTIKIGHFLKGKNPEIQTVSFSNITKFDNFLLLKNKETYKLVDTIISKHPNLEQCSNGKIFRGISIDSELNYISKSPKKNYHKGLRGDSVKKFYYDYFIFIKNKTFSKLDLMKNKKIVLQNIFSSESGIIANFDDKGLVTLDTVTNIILDCEDPYYVLGILNSSLIRFFMVFVIYNQSRLTMHTDHKYLSRIPIPNTTTTIKKQIIKEVKNQLNTQTSFENLNELIFDAFDLSNKEKQLVNTSLREFEQRGKKNG